MMMLFLIPENVESGKIFHVISSICISKKMNRTLRLQIFSDYGRKPLKLTEVTVSDKLEEFRASKEVELTKQ